jgi:hypothetical protein
MFPFLSPEEVRRRFLTNPVYGGEMDGQPPGSFMQDPVYRGELDGVDPKTLMQRTGRPAWQDTVSGIYGSASSSDLARTLAAISDIETGRGKAFSNPRSSARGAYHFLDENRRWAARNGTPYGDDIASQTKAMEAKLKSDRAFAESKGLKITEPWQDYVLHFQGGPTGTALLQSNPATPLRAALGPRADAIISANPNLAKYATVGDFLGDYKNLYNRRHAQYGGAPAPSTPQPPDGMDAQTYGPPTGSTSMPTPLPQSGVAVNAQEGDSPEQVAMKRKLAMALLGREHKISYAPLNHWTQALAEVAGAGVDALRRDAARKDLVDAGQSERQGQMAGAQALKSALTSPNPQEAVAQGLTASPYTASSMAPLANKIIANRLEAEQKSKIPDYGKAGAIFQGPDNKYYSIQFGSNGQRRIEPVEVGIGPDGKPVPLTPAKGVFQAGDEVLDKSTGQTVRSIAPQIEGKEAAEERGKARGQAQVNLPLMVDNAEFAIKTLNQIRNHPGKQYGVGVAGVLPGIPGTQQKGFVELVKQAQGKAFLEAFNSLKGGGQITNVEGEKATLAIARLDRAQNQEDFDSALNDLEEVVTIGLMRAKRKAGASASPQEPAPSGFPNPAASGSGWGMRKLD